MPIFKLIDYGMSGYYETSEESVGRNLVEIARVCVLPPMRPSERVKEREGP
jgi:hypothetical protein